MSSSLTGHTMEGSHCVSSAHLCARGHPPRRRKWIQMYYFYVLQFNKNKKLYKGFCSNLRRRISEHRSGKSDFTSRNGDFKLVFYEAYLNKKDAESAEKYFKTGHGREVLKDKLRYYLGGIA